MQRSGANELREHRRSRAVGSVGSVPSRSLVLSGKVLGEHIYRGDCVPRFARAGIGSGTRTAGRLHVPRLHVAARLANREGCLPRHRCRPQS